MDWTSNSSCKDLSALAENSISATSQGAGNMMSSNEQAMTAPGSQPVTPLPPTRDQDVPNIEMTAQIPPGTSGKPPARPGTWNPPRPSWTRTSSPDVVRRPAPVPPDPSGDASESGRPGLARGAMSGRASTTVNTNPGGGAS